MVCYFPELSATEITKVSENRDMNFIVWINIINLNRKNSQDKRICNSLPYMSYFACILFLRCFMLYTVFLNLR